MSHENSISIEVNGEFVNISTVVGGIQRSASEAVRLFRSGKSKRLGNRSFKTMDDAVNAARERSEAFKPERESPIGKLLKRS